MMCLQVAVILLIIQVSNMAESRATIDQSLAADLDLSLLSPINERKALNEPKPRHKRCYHNCEKPFVMKKKGSGRRICEFDPCDPPEGKYFIWSDPDDKMCHCYGKGRGLPLKPQGAHEWWKRLPSETKDPNANVKPDETGKCTCTFPKVVLDMLAHPQTPYNDR